MAALKLAESNVPQLRVRTLDSAELRSEGEYVLYWMIAFRRLQSNFALQRAVDWSVHLKRPLLILEPLRCDYPWASPRLHQFVVDGMADNAARAEEKRAYYYAFVESRKGAGKGLLEALGEKACLVVTDDYPAFFLPRMISAAAAKLPVPLEAVDSNGMLPMRAVEKVYSRAYDFRRFLQADLYRHLADFPLADPLENKKLPKPASPDRKILDRWPPRSAADLKNSRDWIPELPLKGAAPATDARGGSEQAAEMLDDFIQNRLSDYADKANHPDENATSELSPWLHFGHISAHQVFRGVVERGDAALGQPITSRVGKVDSWWSLDSSSQNFIDQLVTWREIGFDYCSRREDYDQYDSLPEWAQKTLAEHADDPRDPLYSLEEFEEAETHDEIWNAAQTQLRREGKIHNYLRMLWGKKVLHWSSSPQEALKIMIELNDKYALDGRDPNSYSGILWCLGRYDRAWGPERPIFGKIRYMTSKSTRRKLRLKNYLKRYGRG